MKLKKKFTLAWRYLKKNKKYIYFSIWVFLFFLIIGIFLPIPIELKNMITEMLKKLVEQTQNLGTFEMILFIFKNNFIVSIMGIFLGVIFCIIPFIFAVSNGYILGFIFKSLIEELGIGNGILSLWKLLPHGIFELPAIFISLGIGLRLGVSVFSSLNKNSFKIFFEDFKNSFRVFVFIVIPLLIIAAVIEGILLGILK